MNKEDLKENLKIIFLNFKKIFIFLLIVLPISVLFAYLTKDFDKNIIGIFLFIIMILFFISNIVFLFYKDKELTERDIKEINEIKFGKYYTTNHSQLTFFDKIKTIFLVFVGFLTFFLLSLSIYSIYLLYSSFDKKIDTTSINSWGATGDYIGGVTGTILSSIACCMTLFVLHQQQKQMKISQNEIKQQQFETTLFSLLDKINQYKKDEDLMPFYLLLRLIYAKIKEYSNNNKEIERTYNDIIKTHIDWNTAYRMIDDIIDHLVNREYINEIYLNIKYIIEECALFEYIPKEVEVLVKETNLTETKKISNNIEFFKISAFEGNMEVMPLRISFEKKHDKLEEYLKHDDAKVRQAVARVLNTPKELDILSQDDDVSVRCEVARNKNVSENILQKLANDNNRSVRFFVAHNSKTSKEILKLLLEDKDKEVCYAAVSRLKLILLQAESEFLQVIGEKLKEQLKKQLEEQLKK